jgi:hypothetical protein
MNTALIAGGVAAAAGITAGVLLERQSQSGLDARNDAIDRDANEWLAGAHRQFDGAIEEDRTRNRDLSRAIEDYKTDNPMPSSVSFGRSTNSWGQDVVHSDRDGFWGITLGAAGAGGAVVGGTTLGIALDSSVAATRGSRIAAATGAAVLAAGLGVAAGSIVSNWTH